MTKQNMPKQTTKISMEKEYAIAFLKIFDKRTDHLMLMQAEMMKLQTDKEYQHLREIMEFYQTNIEPLPDNIKDLL